MNREIFVGNLDYKIDKNQLKDLFSAIGPVEKADIITDRETGQSKGFGFVRFDKPETAQKAIAEFNEKKLNGRKIVIQESQNSKSDSEKEDTPNRKYTPDELPGPDDLR